MNKMFYGPYETFDNSYLISPIPHISIGREINYSNDLIIGYTYNVNINGYATNPSGIETVGNTSSNISQVLENIEKIKGILSYNGSTLRLLDNNNKVLIAASGGILKSLTFDQSSNNWSYYAPYSATIEFNDIQILEEKLSTGVSGISVSTNIIDINQHKIKNFTENWTFELADNYYHHVSNSDTGQLLEINNSIINVTYNLSATGKNYYIADGNQIKTKAAWLQAKEFVQERLCSQVKALIGGVLNMPDNNDQIGEICKSDKTLGPENIAAVTGQDDTQIYFIDSSSQDHGILKDIKDKYKVYNETITCNTSESEGSFSITYNSLLKRNKQLNNTFDNDNVIHTFTKTINNTINNTIDFNRNISIEGKIEGLIEGGLIARANATSSSGVLELPSNGRLLISHSGNNKFNNALNFLPSIIDLANDDLQPSFKTALGITYSGLGITGNWNRSDPFLTNTVTCTNDPESLLPTSFNLTKNYIDANIGYSLEYLSTKNGKGNKDKFITFSSYSVDEPVSILAEHNFPGSFYATPSREGYTIYQDIDTVTPRKISIVIEGRDIALRRCEPCGTLISDVISGVVIPDIPDTILPDPELYILTSKQTTWNPREGSYVVNINYICKPGCKI